MFSGSEEDEEEEEEEVVSERSSMRSLREVRWSSWRWTKVLSGNEERLPKRCLHTGHLCSSTSSFFSTTEAAGGAKDEEDEDEEAEGGKAKEEVVVEFRTIGAGQAKAVLAPKPPGGWDCPSIAIPG